MDCLSGDIPSLLGGQKRHSVGNILRLAQPAQGNLLHQGGTLDRLDRWNDSRR